MTTIRNPICETSRKKRVAQTAQDRYSIWLVVALSVRNEQLLYRQRAHIDLPQLVAFMDAIRTAFPKTEVIFVIQDNGHNVHFHPKQIAAAEAAGIHLIRAPSHTTGHAGPHPAVHQDRRSS